MFHAPRFLKQWWEYVHVEEEVEKQVEHRSIG